jgi:hypothetical protein
MATDPTFVPEPIVIHFAKGCLPILREIAIEVKAEQDRLDGYGLADLYGRTKELIQRIALVVSQSCRADKVEISHLKWARDYVMLYTRRMVALIGENLDKSDVEQITDKVYDMIAKAGERGMTEREISTNCRPFRRLSEKDRKEVFYRLTNDHGVPTVLIETAGRQRKAFVVKKKKR